MYITFKHVQVQIHFMIYLIIKKMKLDIGSEPALRLAHGMPLPRKPFSQFSDLDLAPDTNQH